jgi:hypothetical protein
MRKEGWEREGSIVRVSKGPFLFGGNTRKKGPEKGNIKVVVCPLTALFT